MKYFLIFVIAISLFTACQSKSSEQSIAKKEITTSVISEETTTTNDNKKTSTSHLCNAPTKDGGTCKRRVSNDKGLNAYCWMHQK